MRLPVPTFGSPAPDNSVAHTAHPRHFLDIMDSDNISASSDRQGYSSGGALYPLAYGQAQYQTDGGLAGSTHQQWVAQSLKLVQPFENLQVMVGRFAKAN